MLGISAFELNTIFASHGAIIFFEWAENTFRFVYTQGK